MQQTPSSHRVHIAFFGRCNSGKSSLINALAGQEVAIVSEMAGTTTDSVLKPIELPGVGATILIDTPGLDDNTPLGNQRKTQSLKALDKTDIAVVLFHDDDTSVEEALITQLSTRKTPIIGVISKCDTMQNRASLVAKVNDIIGSEPIALSATTREGIEQLFARLASLSLQETRLITEGLCSAGDMVVLVMPQDAQAPKGRLIKPQVEVLRELLDRGCNTLCCTPEGLKASLNTLNTPPQLIITDSQVFASVNEIVEEYRQQMERHQYPLLTSFSILFARYKGDINTFIEGGKKLLSLTPYSRILIAEACSHIPQNEDIGRVKLPRMLRRRIGDSLTIDIVGGNDFPTDLSQYDLVIHCGACMFNRRLVMSRVAQAQIQNIAITNYGIAIATLTGIIDKVAY
ncbi:MAG: [FeFe] hydrogenase H-cluster maturation GTPase HydF [Bacteroidales bacterium]|nr:[FeFe] hydrogenase H-cluster maturation GTPase HydF [Bacteroidales bacterium]